MAAPSSRSVCIAVDGSASSSHAATWACSKLLRAGDEVTLVHMFEFKHTKPALEAVVLLQSLDATGG